ncbi:MAG: serine acetyltransferase [Fibrobacter sp.]|nr:serine acetyltransferase [Fibrobacter sp.]
MIETRKKLNAFLKADYIRQGMKHPLVAKFTFGEHAVVWSYIKNLRYVEYYHYKKNHSKAPISFLWAFLYGINLLLLRRKSLKTQIFISPDTCGPGLLLPHPGPIRVSGIVRMGQNCTILPSVLFGRRSPEATGRIIVGDGCYFGAGCSIIGPLTIGDNVIVGAGAVVTKDAPSNSVVVGVPAKNISTK